MVFRALEKLRIKILTLTSPNNLDHCKVEKSGNLNK